MDIILRVVNRNTGEGIFIDGSLGSYDQKEVIALVKERKINNLSLAKINGKTYIRTKPNTKTIDNIACRTISLTELMAFYKNYSKSATNQKIKGYDAVRRKKIEHAYIFVKDDKGDFTSTKTTEDIKQHLEKNRGIIFEAARKQKIDPFLLGAILIDEYCRKGWDDWLDWLGALNVKDTSVGVAQIKLSTAREIIKKQYYNPAPGKITAKSSSAQIWWYLNQQKHSIHFAAAAITLSIVYWRKKKIDISKQPKILAYLYSYGYTKDIKRASVKRAIQVSAEFYRMAKSILS